ncbi:MAG: putative DNA-binding domain-containing protein [Pseudomonadales bacterium]|nr:putative DNA-binding domain-containing protein [Pseudomonadales bacterium]
MPEQRPDLRATQLAFTSYLRDPDQHPIPDGLDERRINVYRQLIFNNVSSLLSDFFPVIRTLLDQAEWDQLVRDFLVTHQADTPYFTQLAGEFVDFLATRQAVQPAYPFLTELAHYEWVELALYISEDSPPQQPVPDNDLQTTSLTLSPVAWPLQYRFAVHRIGVGYCPTEPDEQPASLLVFRDRSESVRFYELQPMALQLLLSIQETPGLVPEQWLSSQADIYNYPDKGRFIAMGMQLLQQLNGLGVLTQSESTRHDSSARPVNNTSTFDSSR